MDRPTADEIKEVIRPVKAVLARLPEGWQTEQAEKALDTVRDHAMRSLEGALAPEKPLVTTFADSTGWRCTACGTLVWTGQTHTCGGTASR